MRLALFALLLPAALAGCGKPTSCQSACQLAFLESECSLRVPGRNQDELVRECTRECNRALRTTGELGGYDPNNPNSVDRSRSFELQNEKQAAVWIDCVMETSCFDLDRGFCPGGGIN